MMTMQKISKMIRWNIQLPQFPQYMMKIDLKNVDESCIAENARQFLVKKLFPLGMEMRFIYVSSIF